jgi:predicted glycoside hydrolase/deacetylase ChbG (UPF0249 family)
MDMGVHATLNAEFDNYRWGPISTLDPASGLIDAQGYFHQWHPAVYQNAKPAAVELEVNAQVERALSAGIDVTHIDSHMFTFLNPLYIQSYIQAAASRQLPNMLPRLSATGIEIFGMGPDTAKTYEPFIKSFESMGMPMLDGIVSMPLEHDQDHIGVARRLLGELPVGITHFIFHPSIDTPELRAICPDWPARVANYNAFMSADLKKIIEQENLKLIGYRQIRNTLRS